MTHRPPNQTLNLDSSPAAWTDALRRIERGEFVNQLAEPDPASAYEEMLESDLAAVEYSRAMDLAEQARAAIADRRAAIVELALELGVPPSMLRWWRE